MFGNLYPHLVAHSINAKLSTSQAKTFTVFYIIPETNLYNRYQEQIWHFAPVWQNATYNRVYFR